MPSTITYFILRSQAPWKHSAHQRPRKLCDPKPTRRSLSHLLDKVFTSMSSLHDSSEFSQHAIWAECQKEQKKLFIFMAETESSNQPHSWDLGSVILHAEWGWPGMAQGRTVVPAAEGSESSCTESFSTPSTASYICLSPPLPTPS